MRHETKTVGTSGQISLGKEHAGKTVIVEQPEAGVWVIKTARVIPDNELWLYEPKARKALDEALAWPVSNPRKRSNLGSLKRKFARR